MKTIYWIVITALLIGAWIARGAATSSPPAAAKPNVVFILTDDQGWGDLSLHGNRWVETPTLDRLANSGAQFERFFVSPLCAPTRASLLTGRYHLRTGTVSVTQGWERMRSTELTLAEVFRQNGYATGCFGKWHNGEHAPEDPNGQGFDEFLGFCGGHWNNYFDTDLQHNDRMVSTHGFITDVLTDAALTFMSQHKTRPFFCYVPFNAPHSPHQVADRYFDKYKAKGLDDEQASIYGMVENVDDNVKRLLARLDQLGLTQNTIVVFATDNGPNGHRFNGKMKGIKGSVDEGGVRVPLFVRWPGKIRPQTWIRPNTAHIDLLPTLVVLCSLRFVPLNPIDGRSLAGNLLGQTDTLPDRMLFTHVGGMSAGGLPAEPGSIRTSQYRLVLEKEQTRLYDMLGDPSQSTDLAAGQPQQVRTLQAAYERWFGDVCQTIRPSRPVPVAARRVLLQAPEAHFTGKVRYKQGNGWANDWLINWQSPADSIWWDVEVERPGVYQMSLQYTAGEAALGTRLTLTAGTKTLQQTLQTSFDPPLKPSPDRIPRKEVYEKPWAWLGLGKLKLPGGHHRILLQASSVPHGQVADVKALLLTALE
ncbi:arylsulfatase [Spirosoma endophyticum]|uniref:Arylsulfatase A n=1 Tax=Spirosoma endophyticum TaxID=662367 RepID=A0A1I1SAD5_9BACT|nr:arylsulfatase [Spirosoma endophyticum]SFD43347.1 arylsulfatase A [Spirosoma endophyticum]